MTKLLRLCIVCVVFYSDSLQAASAVGDSPKKPSLAATKPDIKPGEQQPSRVVKYAEQDVVSVRAKLRYTTLIILPKEEEILDFICGDKEYWVVNGTRNFAFIKPAKGGSSTNINLITASGNVYSFEMSEISETQGAAPDLKVFIEPREESMISSLGTAPRFVPADAVENYRELLELAEARAREAKKEADDLVEARISRFVTDYPSSLHFAYRFARNKKPFRVTAIYDDGRYTYIQANPEESPALYEIKDGEPNLVSFEFSDGTYIVPKVMESGYLAIGKRKLNFVRKD